MSKIRDKARIQVEDIVRAIATAFRFADVGENELQEAIDKILAIMVDEDAELPETGYEAWIKEKPLSIMGRIELEHSHKLKRDAQRAMIEAGWRKVLGK